MHSTLLHFVMCTGYVVNVTRENLLLSMSPVCVVTSAWFKKRCAFLEWPITAQRMRHRVCRELKPVKWIMATEYIVIDSTPLRPRIYVDRGSVGSRRYI